MSTARFLINGTPVCDMGLETCTLALRAGGPDILSFIYSRDSTGTPPFAVHASITVTWQVRDNLGEITSTTTLFVGRITSRRAARAGGDGWSYVAENGWGDLRRIVMTQTTKSWDPENEVVVDRDVSRVILGMDASGSYQNTGATLGEIITLAAAKGANLSAGTLSPALTVPPTEIVDTTCDAAFRQILAYHPDHIAWIEGSSMQVRPPSALSSIAIAPCTDGIRATHDPQSDEIPAGVVIVWERTHTYNGAQKIERIEQTAGATSGWPPPLRMTIPLNGTEVTTREQLIQTRTIPDPEDLNTVLAKKFFKGLIPAIADANDNDIAFTGLDVEFADPQLDELESDGETVNPNSRPIDREEDTEDDFPRMLVDGQVQPWFPSGVKQYDAILRAKIWYRGTDAAIRKYVGPGLEVDLPIVITNALPKVYRVTDSITAGEDPISGLASSYYAAISQARNEGTLSGDLLIDRIGIRPGRTVTVTGHFTDPSPVTAVTWDCLDKTFEATYGNSSYLDPKSIAELARAMAKNRPAWKREEERTKAETGAGTGAVREGSTSSTKYAEPARFPEKLWSITVTDPETGAIQLANPGTIIKDFSDLTTTITIGSVSSTFTPTDGQSLRLKLTGTPDAPVVTLECAGDWTDHPAPVETTGSGATAEFEAYYYPLWRFHATDDTGREKIKNSLFAERLAPDTHLVRVGVGYHKNGDYPFGIGFFLGYHKAWV